MPKTLTATNDVAAVSRKSYTQAFPNMPGNSTGCIYMFGRLLLLCRSLLFSLPIIHFPSSFISKPMFFWEMIPPLFYVHVQEELIPPTDAKMGT